MEETVLDYLVKVYEVYIELKDNNYESTISRQILEAIISTGKSIYSNKNHNIRDKLSEIIFLLCFVEKLSSNRKFGNFNVANLDEIIKEGKSLCLDLGK
jgi:SMC interacting uncharacterized protein involved in chromosome segregation